MDHLTIRVARHDNKWNGAICRISAKNSFGVALDRVREERDDAWPFMAKQTDEWVIRFYVFLDEQKALWRPPRWGREAAPLRNKPFIRLQNCSHVSPFYGGEATPRAYLPLEEETALPTVRREVAANDQARKFLISLGLTEPNIVDEVIEEVLPKYRRPDAEAEVTHSEHERDVRKIMRALEDAFGTREERLVGALCATPFLLARNPATESVAFQNPWAVYMRSPELETYFEGILRCGSWKTATTITSASSPAWAWSRACVLQKEAEHLREFGGARSNSQGARLARSRSRRLRPGMRDRRSTTCP